MGKISVIVPVYRVEAYLSRCIDSVLGQSFADFDLILVDDGSPDNSGAICDRYALRDKRVHVIHQKNGGLSAARNAGIDWAFSNSDSAYLSFIDSDDWVCPAFLERLLEAAETLQCPVSACGVFRTGGTPLPDAPDAVPQRRTADEFYCGSDDFPAVVAWNKLYQKGLFASLRYPQGKLHEDEFTTYRAIYAAGAVAVVPIVLYAYFQNPKGITGSKWSRGRMDSLEAFTEQISFAREIGNSLLLEKASLSLIYGAYDQLAQADRSAYGALRRYLRQGLAMGRETGCFPREKKNLWAYEAAYPCKSVWWLISRLK